MVIEQLLLCIVFVCLLTISIAMVVSIIALVNFVKCINDIINNGGL